MAGVKAQLEEKIKTKKVMVFSKSYCPYCQKAKRVLKQYIGKEVPRDQVEIWDFENDPNAKVIQAHLRKMTGASSVPRVFINGKCIGGGNETEQLDQRGKLKAMLTG